jgi:hypothetical protein
VTPPGARVDRPGGGLQVRGADLLEDLAFIRTYMPRSATWAELAAELGVSYAALTRAVQRARARGVVVPSPTPGPRGWAAWGKQNYNGV